MEDDKNLPEDNQADNCCQGSGGGMEHKSSSPYIKLIFVLLTAAFIWTASTGRSRVLTIFNQKTGEIYLQSYVSEGDIIEYSWIHSFEHIPWTEEYELQNDNELMLTSIAVAGFGAGIPENKGEVSVEDGIIIMRNINQSYEEINWINSNTALTHIGLNGSVLIKGSDLPHHEPCTLKVKERYFIWPRFR